MSGIQQLPAGIEQVAVDGAMGGDGSASQLLSAQLLLYHAERTGLHLALDLHIDRLSAGTAFKHVMDRRKHRTKASQ